MAVSAVQGNYVCIQDPNTGETYQLTREEYASLFGNEDYLGAEDSFATKTVDINMVSVDGKDDGKITFDEKVKSGFKAVADMVLSPITEAAKGNFVPALVAGAGIAIGILTFPVGTIAIGAIGVAGGVATFAKGASAAEGATSDAEAREAYGTMAQGLYTAGMSAGAMAKSIQVQKSNPNSNMYGTKGFKATAKGYFKDLGQGAGKGVAGLRAKVSSMRGSKTTTTTSGGSGSDFYYDNGNVYKIETAYDGTEILTKIETHSGTGSTGTGSGNGSVIYGQDNHAGMLALEQKTVPTAGSGSNTGVQYRTYGDVTYKVSGTLADGSEILTRVTPDTPNIIYGQDNHAGMLALEQKTTPIVTPEEAAIMQYQEQVAGFQLYT